MEIRQAVILAGGRGKRLRPFTDTNNKVMYPINGKPFLWHLVKLLKKNGIKKVLVLTGWKHEKVRVDYPELFHGVEITYHYTPFKSWFREIQSTIRIKNVFHLLDDYFLLMYCDNWWELKLDQIKDYPGNVSYQKKDIGFWRLPKILLRSGANLPIERYLEEVLPFSWQTTKPYYSISDPVRAKETERYLSEM